MKKLSFIMAILIAVVSCCCFSVSAAVTEMNLAVNAPSEIEAGKEFTVAVDFSESTGFSTLGVKLTYPEGFAYVDGSAKGSELADEEFLLEFGGETAVTYTIHHDESARTLTFVGATMYDITGDGELFNAKFTAPDASGENFTFEVSQFDVAYNEVGDTVTVTKTNDSMNVTEIAYILGDVDENGTIQTADAMLAFFAATKKITLTETQLLAANVLTADALTTADAMRIFYFATKKITSF